MSSFRSFEQLVVRNEVGYVCDETSLVRLSSQGSFDGAVIKLVTKCETNMVLLSGHGEVDRFTIDVVVIDNQQRGRGNDDVMAQAWPKCEVKGYHGLLALARVDGSLMPDNGCKEKYSLAQFVNYLIHGVESYFMFQKPSPFFALNALDLWQAFEELAMESCYIVMAWKYKEDPRREAPLRSPLIQLNTSTTTMRSDKVKQQSVSQTPVTSVQVKTKKRISLQPQNQVRELSIASKRGRRSVQPQVTTDNSEEEDNEIIIKKQPDPVSAHRGMTPKKESLPAEAGTTKAQSEDKAGDIIFGFERSQPKTPGRKSMARKSMMQDWSEDHKNEILWFFDNLNPKESEQTCIALTCKFASMKFDQELSSKLLYLWIQKKGRTIQKTVDCYDLPETDREKLMIDFFKSLNSELSETSRVAFTCKYMQTQFGVNIQSKQFYSMLNDKGKKSRKR